MPLNDVAVKHAMTPVESGFSYVRTDLDTQEYCATKIRPGRAWTGARSEPWENSNRFVVLSVQPHLALYTKLTTSCKVGWKASLA